METLWQQQDGGYALLWKRYGNNKMAAMRYNGNYKKKKDYKEDKFSLYTELVIDVFYIFNSTVVD